MKTSLSRIEPRITVRAIDGIDSYDIDNYYPKRVRDIVDNSGMGSTCVETFIDYIYGRGFQDTDFAKQVINRDGLTNDGLLRLICEDLGYIGGFSPHINWNANYEIWEINYQCIDDLRFVNSRDKVHYGMYAKYPDWKCTQRSYDRGKPVYIDKYNPSPTIIEQQKINAGGWNEYKGQILYVSNRLYQYPKAVYDAVLEDMMTDSKAKTFKNRNITNNFLASHLLITDKFESTEPREGRRNPEVENFIDTLGQFQGAEEAGKIMHIEKDTPEQTFELIKVDQQNGDQLYSQTESTVQDNIRKRFRIPAILLQQQAGRLGATQEFVDATNYYNSITENPRLLIESVFRILYSRFPGYESKQDNYFILPKEAIKRDEGERTKQVIEIIKDAALSSDQKESILVNLYGVPEEDVKKFITVSDTKEKQGGVERDPTQLFNGIQTTSMIGVVDAYKAGRLTSDEAKSILRISFRLNDEELNSVIGNGQVNNSRTDSGL